MYTKVKKIFKRWAAGMMAVLMFVSLLPIPVIARAEITEAVTITVKDGEGMPIEGATVEVVIYSESDDESDLKIIETNALGQVEVMKNTEFVENKYSVSATVSKDRYQIATLDKTNIVQENQNFNITLSPNGGNAIEGVSIVGQEFSYDTTAHDAVLITGIQDGDVITYCVNGGVTSNEMPSVLNVGTYSITVTVERDEYDILEKTVTTIVKRANIEIDILENELAYNGEEQELVSVSGNFEVGDIITWEVDGVDTGSSEVPKKTAVGTYNVKLTVDRNENYNVLEKTVEVSIAPGTFEVEGVIVNGNDLTYTGEQQDAITVTKDEDVTPDYTLYYKLDDGVWSTEIPKVTEAGSYIVWVKAVKTNYEGEVAVIPSTEAVEPYNVYVKKAEQEIKFVNDTYNAESSTISIDDVTPFIDKKFDFAAIIESGIGQISYEIILVDRDIATIEDNGKVTVFYPGEITVKATLAGDENHEKVFITHVLTVKAVPAAEDTYVKFGNTEVEYILGENGGVVSNQTVTNRNEKDDGTVEYSIDKTNIGLSCDSTSGKVIVKDYEIFAEKLMEAGGALEVIVTANKEASNFYGANSATYKIRISFMDTPETPIVIDGMKGLIDGNETEWYTSAITVTPNNDDYSISSTCKPESFTESVSFDNQGEDKRYVYLRHKENGGITSVIVINEKIDTVAPDKMTIEFSEPSIIELIGNALGFYRYNTTITFTAEDITSGIDHFKWNYIKEADSSASNLIDQSGTLAVTTEDGVAKAVLTLPLEDAEHMRGNIAFSAVDIAGNESNVKTEDRVFVIDNKNPECVVMYNGAEPYVNAVQSIEKKHYFNGAVEVKFTITEVNFYEEIVNVLIQKDGVELSNPNIEIVWEHVEGTDNHVGSFILADDGEYVITIKATDKSGNVMSKDYISETIIVDTTKPEIAFGYNEATQAATLTITEKNFRAEDTIVDIKQAKNLLDVSVNVNDIQAYVKDNRNWTSNGDVHTLILESGTDKILLEAIYVLEFSYKDLAHNEEQIETNSFVVDHTSPYNVSMSYSNPLFEKILEAITFGFYKSSVTVTFTAYDDFSGVKSFILDYIKQDGETDITSLEINADKTDKNKYTATVTLPVTDAEQLRGYLAVTAIDKYGKPSEKVTDTGRIIVVDSIAPTMEVEYSPADREVGNILYYNNDIEVTFKITEANFYKEEVKVMVSKDGGTPYAVTPQWDEASGDTYIGKYVLSGDGDYVITVNYSDYSENNVNGVEKPTDENPAYTSKVLTIDTVAPVVDVKYASTTPINTVADVKGMQRKYFANKQMATITIKEHNFDASNVVLDIKTEDVTGNTLNSTGLYELSEWKLGTEADTHVLEITYLGDANYTFDISYADLATNEARDYTPDYFTVDKSAPVGLSVSYSISILETILETITFGFYNAKVDVTIVAEDVISGVNAFTYSYIKANDVSDVNTEALNEAIAAANITYSNDGKTATAKFQITKDVLSNTTQFNGTIAFDAINRSGLTTNYEDDKRIVVDTIAPSVEVTYNEPVSNVKGIAYYDGDIEFVFNIEEANFFASDVKVFVSKDGANKVQVPADQIKWTALGEDKYTASYTISGDGDYVLYVEYTDKSNNEMIPYQTGVLTIDTTDPVVKIEFDEASQKIVYTVTEHNFRPEDITITGNIVITEKDASGNLKVYTAKDMQDALRKLDVSAWQKAGDVYTYASDDYLEGWYELDFGYKDISGNSAVTATSGKFYIDYSAPVEIEISYSESLFEKVLETITFGFYKSSVTVTFTAYDDRAGVDYFTWNYIKQNGASTVNRDTDTAESKVVAVQDANDKTKYTATVTLPNTDASQLRGFLAVAATDKYGNASEKVTDAGKIVVVDSIAPTMKVEYTPADKVVGDTSYYNNNVEVTFIVTEANFYKEEVKVMVSKDGGTAYAVTPKWTDESADKHIGKYVLSGDGDYVITVNYTDYSTNKMVEYTSKVLTIDTIVPVINVKYANTTPSTTLVDVNGMQRDYFANKQTATITIIEHNFDASSVVLDIKTEDVTGKALSETGLYEVSEWKAGSEVDTHVLEITYFGDANYTFDISNTDLATNKTADYTPDYFTVDKSAPVGLSVSYSTSLLETILEAVTFGFYNAKVDVTIVAEDVISGVNAFAYSYIKANGVSDVNTEVLNEAIAAANIAYSNDGKTATAKFQITKDVLSNTTQFNGTIAFDAINRSGVTANLEDDKRIIVDNIAPTAEVTYNEPVSTENGIAYYDRDIVATVVITEANFYAGDVVITVVKDDVAYDVTPSWTSNSANLHTGTFTLSEDGDYVITINYRDKSSNEMTEYKSGQLTVDTDIQEPAITFNGNNETGHAYKNDIIPAISFSDINYDSYEVFLYRTYMNEINVDITADKGVRDLFTINEESGSASLNIFAANGDGKYDQSDDGIYRLVVKMTDKAGHVSEKEALFTVNRYGSVYAFDEYLVELIADGGAYVKNITNDLVITEFNADQLVTDSLNIEITKDGKPLEDVKYTTSPTINENVAVGESGWYQYEYVISKENFVKDGIYKISISSKDATGNMPENSNYEGKTIVFHVDTATPEITSIVGLEEALYDATEQNVSYVVFDAMGLKSIKVYLDGEILEEITDFTADLNSYSGSFVIPEKETARTVRLVVEDLAGNITDTDSDDFTSAYEFNSKVTVTTDDLARFVANKPLFYGSIAGTTGLAAAAGFGIRFRFKRRMK